MKRSTLALHWSQLTVGMVIRATKTIWQKIDSIEHISDGWLRITGPDTTGHNKGKITTRWIGKSDLIDTEAA